MWPQPLLCASYAWPRLGLTPAAMGTGGGLTHDGTQGRGQGGWLPERPALRSTARGLPPWGACWRSRTGRAAQHLRFWTVHCVVGSVIQFALYGSHHLLVLSTDASDKGCCHQTVAQSVFAGMWAACALLCLPVPDEQWASLVSAPAGVAHHAYQRSQAHPTCSVVEAWNSCACLTQP